jgi:hypothetical protein
VVRGRPREWLHGREPSCRLPRVIPNRAAVPQWYSELYVQEGDGRRASLAHYASPRGRAPQPTASREYRRHRLPPARLACHRFVWSGGELGWGRAPRSGLDPQGRPAVCTSHLGHARHEDIASTSVCVATYPRTGCTRGDGRPGSCRLGARQLQRNRHTALRRRVPGRSISEPGSHPFRWPIGSKVDRSLWLLRPFGQESPRTAWIPFLPFCSAPSLCQTRCHGARLRSQCWPAPGHLEHEA